MRILKLEFENLNSLKGAWSIDFTDPDFARNHDIFVIHGPTGAGKTTILDAITLALYGSTPRLSSITTTSNELMTRGTGRCRATVTYRCKKGVFTSEFMQSRARGKAGGALQLPSWQITAEDGTLVENGKSSSALAKKTQELIQLDYTQFCRSIMLAQGAFNQFLTCGERERAAILEKLTGTERYRAIAKRVYERFSDIDKAFTLKKHEKEQILSSVLPDEVAAAFAEEEKQIEIAFAESDKTLAQLQKVLASYAEKERLEAALLQAEKRAEESNRALADFAPNLEKIRRAQSAKNAESAYAVKEELSRAQQKETHEKEAAQNALLQAQTAFAAAKKAAEETAESLAACDAETEDLRVLWTNVRELDTQIAALHTAAREAQGRRTSAESSLKEAEQERKNAEKSLESLKVQQTELLTWCQAHTADEALPEVIGKAETLSAQIAESEKKLESLRHAAAMADAAAKKAEDEKQAAEAALSALDEEIKAFVSGEALCIIRELQKRLVPGKPCPVCAAVYKLPKGADASQGELDFGASAGEAEAREADSAQTDKARAFSLTSAELNSRYEEARSRLEALSAQAEKARAEAVHAHSALQETESALSAACVQLESLCALWQTSEVSTLKERLAAWKENIERSATCERGIAEKQAQAASCVQAVESRSEELTLRVAEAEKAQVALAEKASARSVIFGEKDVAEEEAAQNKRLQALKAADASCTRALHEAGDALTRIQTQLEGLEKSLAERSPKLEAARAAFVAKLSENGFADEDAFLASRMEDAALASLTQKGQTLQRAEAEAGAALTQCKKAYEDFASTVRLDKPKEALLAEQSRIDAERKAQHTRLVELQSKLSTNAQNIEEARRITSEYDALQKEQQLWKRMKDFVGVKEGDDFSVFVQSIAFNSLLSIANKTLYAITRRYHIVQQSAGSLNFAISDDFYTDLRPITNLSGGEQFIVSLSLALAISKFASSSVRVDSLFLDEGFGTLSGDLLTEAVNALKALQKEGKMLGIITHVSSVIAEIDQKIEVRPTTGGHSVLVGSGITGGGVL